MLLSGSCFFGRERQVDSPVFNFHVVGIGAAFIRPQCFATGKIEEGRLIRDFFKRTGQPLLQDWLIELVRRMAMHLPVRLFIALGMQNLIRPRTRGWAGARDAIEEYVQETKAAEREALGLKETRS